MKSLYTVIIAFTFAVPAFAQQSNPVQEQIERTIGNLIVQNASISAQLQQAQSRIAQLEKENTELKSKLAPAAVAPPAASK